MKLKLTPLNIVSSIFLVTAVVLLFEKKPTLPPGTINLSGILIGFSFLIAVISFVSDLIFRKFIPELKKIWIIECFLIVFTILLIFIIKSA